MSIMTIGDCVIDYYPDLDREFVGGSGLNMAVYLKEKGLDSKLMGVVGDDVKGRKILDYLKYKNFDLTNIKMRNGKTALAYIKKGDNDYEIEFVQEGVKKEYRLNKEDVKKIKNYDLVHTNIYSHTNHLLPYLKEKNRLVSFDYSFKVDYEKLKEIEDYIDILFISKSDVFKKEFSKLKEFNFDYVVLSSGKKGFILLHKGEEYFKDPVGDYVKDSTGAGDTLIAEILLGIHENRELEKTIVNAAKKAYEACLGIGPFHSF